MTTDTLYPHEVIIKWLNDNLFRLNAAILFFLSGYTFYNYIHLKITILNLVLVALFFIIGWCWQKIDYSYRGIQ
jgi:hypothetical protein